MTYVTLTDHNTIDGALQLADRRDFFISEEVTTYFPGEDVKLHLLVLGITEKQHQEIQYLRLDLYELVSYLNSENILYVLSHPLTRLGGELTRGHIERLMLLFPIWEVHNGSTLKRENSMSRRLAEQCSRQKLLELAEKHNIEPITQNRISFTAGSDDHAGFDIASAWTVTAPTASINEFLEEVRAGRTAIRGTHGSTQKLAHTMLGLLAHGAGSCQDKDRSNYTSDSNTAGMSCVGLRSLGESGRKWMRLLSMAVGGEGATAVFKAVKGDSELRKALLPVLTTSAKPGKCGGDNFHDQLFSLVSAAWVAGMRSTLTRISQLTLFNIVGNLDKVGRLVVLQALLLPHSLAANYHSRQRHFLRRLSRELFGDMARDESKMPKVGLFTDTADEVNGVTSILKRLAEYCGQRGRPLTLICAGEGPSHDRLVRFPAAAELYLPDYGELKLSIPPVLDVVKFCEEQGFEVIHAATPGPMGLVAFLVSRILQVPLVTSFHTDVPRCIGRLTGDKLNEEVAWTYIRWFYRRSDLTFVPSVYASRDLAAHGLDHHKMVVLYQGVDTGMFSPDLRSPLWRKRLGGDDKKIILFVG
jgi:hypothetical protein